MTTYVRSYTVVYSEYCLFFKLEDLVRGEWCSWECVLLAGLINVTATRPKFQTPYSPFGCDQSVFRAAYRFKHSYRSQPSSQPFDFIPKEQPQEHEATYFCYLPYIISEMRLDKITTAQL